MKNEAYIRQANSSMMTEPESGISISVLISGQKKARQYLRLLTGKSTALIITREKAITGLPLFLNTRSTTKPFILYTGIYPLTVFRKLKSGTLSAVAWLSQILAVRM